METLVKLNEQTAGRDKIISMDVALIGIMRKTLEKLGILQKYLGVWNIPLAPLENASCSFKKHCCIYDLTFQLIVSPSLVLRLGKFLDSLYSALKTLNYPELPVRITLTLSKITNALYLLADHIIWTSRVGILQVNIEKWNQIANKYWLMNIMMNLTRDVFEIMKILEREGMDLLSGKRKLPLKYNCLKQYQMLICLRNHKDIMLDILRNSCDLFIPLTALGFTKLTPGTIGFFGVISSMIGIYTLVYPMYKLKPS